MSWVFPLTKLKHIQCRWVYAAVSNHGYRLAVVEQAAEDQSFGDQLTGMVPLGEGSDTSLEVKSQTYWAYRRVPDEYGGRMSPTIDLIHLADAVIVHTGGKRVEAP